MPSAQAFSDQYMDFYLNFTVNVNPGSTWPRYTKENRLLLQIKSDDFTPVLDDSRFEYSEYFNRPGVQYEFRR